MRWEALFDDLEAQLRSTLSAGQESEIRDRTRSEQSRVTLVQRLAGQCGHPIGAHTRGGRSLQGILTYVGSEWITLLVDGRSVIVPLSSLRMLRGLGRGVGQPLSGTEARLGLGTALRELSRDRMPVALWLASPASRWAGVIDRVGTDFLELGTGAFGDERRPANSREVLTVPFASIDTIDSTVPGDREE